MKRKKKTKRQKLKEELNTLCAQVCKERDDWTCQWCGKKVEGRDSHWAHIIRRGKGLFLRWDLLNCILLDTHCHFQRWHGGEGIDWFKKKYPARWQYLNEPIKVGDKIIPRCEATVKWENSDLEIIKIQLEKKLKDLRKK